MRSLASQSFPTGRPSRLLPALTALVALLCSSLLTATPSAAALVGINIEVFKNGVSQGTAFGGPDLSNTPLIVEVAIGDTLLFMVQFDASYTVSSFNTRIWRVDDPYEIDFVNGSAKALSGWTFGSFDANPNNSLNDGTPSEGSGNINTFTSTGRDMYRVIYIVQAGVNSDNLRDFTVSLMALSSSGNSINGFANTASVRVDAVPEPASLLLLGSALAGLGLARLRRKGRRAS